MHHVDHLLWEEYNLEEGEARFSAMCGVKPVFGGGHSELGTHNSLLSLGEGRYLELIAHNPEHPKMAGLPKETPANFKPGLFAFVLRSDDLGLTKSFVEQAGLTIERRLEVARPAPGGETLAWRTLVVGGHDSGHFVPAFTDFKGERHPSETAPQGCELLEFSIKHPKHKELARLYRALQIDVPVFQADAAQMLAVVSTPKGRITLASR